MGDEDNAVFCQTCNKCFSTRSTLNRHTRNVHKSNIYLRSKISRLICPEDDCESTFMSDSQLREHLMDDHHIDIILETLEFEYEEDFENWKHTMEDETLAQYVKDTSTKVLAGGATKTFLHCNRSNKYRKQSNLIRKLKWQGSNKIGKTCPSRIEITRDTHEKTNILVEFWKTHRGHTCDLEHIILDKASKDKVARMLQNGMSFEEVLNDIRDGGEEHTKRMMLLKRLDLRNIVRDYNITYSTNYKLEDTINIKLWAQEMHALGDECPVLFFKNIGEECYSFKSEDFILIIMTIFQCSQISKSSSGNICIDKIHGTYPNDIKMFTLLTVDEFDDGCPVAFCFSNRNDEILFRFFFEKIKEKVGVVNTFVFMSDDVPAFYDAWSSVMSVPQHKLLCSWHVDSRWKKHLNKIKGGKHKSKLVHQTLKHLLENVESKDTFHELLNKTVTNLLNDLDTKDFGEYFVKLYAARPECWAYCYRLILGINTNMYLESFLSVLKINYLAEKKVKGLGKTINAVMRLVRDCILDRFMELCEQTPNATSVNKSHESSFNIGLDMIEIVKPNSEWVVKSSNSKSEYVVSKILDVCSDPCLKCEFCNICIHCFKCTCNDNVIKMNICKHIHACSKFVDPSLGIDTMVNEVAEIVELKSEEQPFTPNAVNENLKYKASLVLDLVDKADLNREEATVVEEKLDYLINLLNNKCQQTLQITRT